MPRFKIFFSLSGFFIFFLLEFGVVRNAFSQDTIPEIAPPGEYIASDTIQYKVKETDVLIINEIIILGNKVTKPRIILRELPFSKNDSVGKNSISSLLKSAKENILNTSLFNFVTLDTIPAGPERINLLITVAERWYTWPAPVFEVQERNFSDWWQTKNFQRANYGFYLNRENFRGRKEDLSFYFQFGYTEKYGISYKVPYLTRTQGNGVGLSFTYSRNHEVWYKTVDNKLVYFKDPDLNVREELNGKLYYTYRKGIHQLHTVESKFVQASIHDTLNDLTIDYFRGYETDIRYFSLAYSYKRDYRDSRIYPLKGYLLELEVNKLGLGILNREKIDVTNTFLTLKKYEKLSNRFYISSALRIKYSQNWNQPYFVQRGLGWGDYVRGYEKYVIDGHTYGMAKLGLRYEIVKPRIQKIPYMPFKKFNTFHYALYAGIYGDAGYVEDRKYSMLNPLANSLLYGYGAGVDFVTYYDIVFRFEYSFNKMLDHGFFVSFSAGI